MTIPTKYKNLIGSLLTLLPLLLAALTVEPYGVALAACLAALWWPMQYARLNATGIVLIVLQDIALRHGNTQGIVAALLCVALAGEVLLLYAQKDKNPEIYKLNLALKPPMAFYPALALGAALMMAMYQLSGYFAAGIRGTGVAALLRAYQGMGFYPNWRTVLFSTIILVVLITWPRKFKTLSRVLPAGFVGLVIVTALNFVLNPDPARSTVMELPLGWLPFFSRVPISALAMLLIYTAWDEVPWKRVAACFRSPARGALPMVLVMVAMFSFDMLWALGGLALAWDVLCVYRAVALRRKRDAPNESKVS